MFRFVILCCSLALMLAVSACERKPSEPAGEATSTTPDTEQIAPAPVANQPTPVTGTVQETMNAAGYTYMLVDTESGEKWVAINETEVEKGAEITYMDGMVMPNFYSKTLDRTFPEIIFSSGLVGEEMGMPAGGAQMPAGGESFSEALAKEGGGMPAELTTGSQKAIVPFADIQVNKASGENSFTVEELYAKAAELAGQRVTVKGKVMKVSPRIMGRNWLHLQDGTGDAQARTHDLVVTTSQEPLDDWDIVTVEGVVAADKDFGAGYTYAVLLEDASVTAGAQ